MSSKLGSLQVSATAEARLLRDAADAVEFLHLRSPTVVVSVLGVSVKALQAGHAIELRSKADPRAGWQVKAGADKSVLHRVRADLARLKARTAKPATKPTWVKAAETPRLKASVQRVSLDDFAAAQGLQIIAREPAPAWRTAVDPAALGQPYLLSLIEDGTLMPTAALAQAWGLTPQRLRRLVQEGELAGLKVNNRLWVPASLLAFASRDMAQTVCRAVAPWPAIEQLLFLSNAHAALDGRTVAQAANAGHTAQVHQLIGRLQQRR